MYKSNRVLKIQSLCRGFLQSNSNIVLKDNMTLSIVDQMLQKYIEKIEFNEMINKKLSKKKIRNENFPSEISENIAKFAIAKKYKIMPCWDTSTGDLDFMDKKLEIKGFSSNGPSSFGPTEKWDMLYFVDAINFKEKNFKVWEIKLSNTSEKWRNLVISGKIFDTSNIPNIPSNLDELSNSELKKLCEDRGISCSGNKKKLISKLKNNSSGSKFNKIKTYGMLVDSGKGGTRPHICFDSIKEQLKEECKIIWTGNLKDL